MVYDCFIFFNELDLLEVRLHELGHVVDKFVLVEADRTFQNNHKPFYFEENKERFRQFSEKIIHVKLTRYPKFNKWLNPFSPWKMETYQRNSMVNGLKNCEPNDIVLFSDVDEIPNPDVIREYIEKDDHQICGLKMHMFMYFFNNKVVFSEGSKMTEEEGFSGLWHCSAIMPYKLLKKTPERYRRAIMRTKRKGEVYKIIPNAGWHFTYLGGVSKIKEKLEAFSHTEYNNKTYKNTDRIINSLIKGKDLFGRNIKYRVLDKNDGNLPEYLRSELVQEKLSEHFFPT